MPSAVVVVPVQFAVSPKSNQETCFNNWSAKIFGVKLGFSAFGSAVASTTSSPTLSSLVSAAARLERVRGLFSSATVVSSFFSAAAVVSSVFSVATVVSSFFSGVAVVSSVFSSGVTPFAAVVSSAFSAETSYTAFSSSTVSLLSSAGFAAVSTVVPSTVSACTIV